jgi:hypothetical protein
MLQGITFARPFTRRTTAAEPASRSFEISWSQRRPLAEGGFLGEGLKDDFLVIPLPFYGYGSLVDGEQVLAFEVADSIPPVCGTGPRLTNVVLH